MQYIPKLSNGVITFELQTKKKKKCFVYSGNALSYPKQAFHLEITGNK